VLNAALVLGVIACCSGFVVVAEWRAVAFGNSRDYWNSGGQMLIAGGVFGFLIFVDGFGIIVAGKNPIPGWVIAFFYVCAAGGLCSALAYAFCLRAVPRSTRPRARYRRPPVTWDRTRWLKGREIRPRFRRFGYVLTIGSLSLLGAAIVLTIQ